MSKRIVGTLEFDIKEENPAKIAEILGWIWDEIEFAAYFSVEKYDDSVELVSCNLG